MAAGGARVNGREVVAIAIRLVLLCAGGSAAMRGGAFPHPDDPIDAASSGRIGQMSLPATTAAVLCGPTRAARETAMALGVEAGIEPALADADHGAWAGLALDAIDPVALAAWADAPHLGAPGGEASSDVTARVAPWLDRMRGGSGVVLAITHAAVVRAALATVLGVEPRATLAIDIAPLSMTRLSFHDRWRLQELRRA